jgi:hypothetical protein
MSGYANYQSPSVLQNFPLNNETFLHHIEHVEVTNDVLISEGLGELVNKNDECQTVIKDLELSDGQIVTVDGSIVGGTFRCQWDGSILRCKNNAVESDPYEIAMKMDEKRFVTREVNHHPDSSQHFIPFETKKFGMFLGSPCADASSVKFYLFDGTTGVMIHPEVWHQPPVPLDGKSMMFYTQQARSHNCVIYDTIDRDRRWLCV